MPKKADDETYPQTDHGTHVATRRGYAEGRVIEPGEAVPAGIAVAEEWMVEAAEAPVAEEEPAAE